MSSVTKIKRSKQKYISIEHARELHNGTPNTSYLDRYQGKHSLLSTSIAVRVLEVNITFANNQRCIDKT